MYKVILSAHGNPYRYQDPNMEVAKRKVASAESVEECQRIVRDYIDDNVLGEGNWTGGDVFLDDERIGCIAYNGTFFRKGL